MSVKTVAGFALVGFGLAGCADADPTAVEGPLGPEELGVEQREAHPQGSARAALLSDIPVTFEASDGVVREGLLTITGMEAAEGGESGLLMDGLLEFEEAGVWVTEVFSDVPADLSRTSMEGTAGLMAQRSPNETGVCDILFLDLGPIFLDLLGLTVDLSQIELDVDAVPGAGNLLGNLLCAVAGLLDGGVDAALGNLLDRINDILDGVTGLLNDIPVTGLLDGGIFEGTLSITELALNEAGDLVASGVLSGTVDQGGTLTEIEQTFQDVTLGLSETLGGLTAGLMAARGANESGVCDILYLELGPVFLDVLGLTVDLAQIELDIDAQRGSGNLLGNLLCELTGLLDGGIGGLLDSVEGLLDRINNLLG